MTHSPSPQNPPSPQAGNSRSTNSTPAQPVPLWQQLQATASVIQNVKAGQSTTRLLPQVAGHLRPGVQSQVFLVLRHLGKAQALRQQLVKRPPPPSVDALLCTAIALACADEAPYEAYVLVDQAVEAAKRNPQIRAQANFINACLRRYLRETPALNAAIAHDPVAQWNHPQWWIDQLRRDHPQQWQQILQANDQHPPLAIRVNERKISFDEYLNRLTAAKIEFTVATSWGESTTLRLKNAVPVQSLPGFEEGLFSVQDSAAQIAGHLLLDGLAKNSDAIRILDACAAPGGKTAHLLELCDAQVTALDVDPARCERIHQNLARLGLRANIVAADAAIPETWWDGKAFDAVLLDAPCTASGIVRRHPDVRWLRRPTDISQLVAQQSRLLNALWPLVRPGGRLLYCTCSVFLAEGSQQIETFLKHNTNAQLRTSPGHLLPTIRPNDLAVKDNQQGDFDGFFYALLEKSPH